MWNTSWVTPAGDTADPRVHWDHNKTTVGHSRGLCKREGQGDNTECQGLTLLSRGFQGLQNPPLLCHIQYLGLVPEGQCPSQSGRMPWPIFYMPVLSWTTVNRLYVRCSAFLKRFCQLCSEQLISHGALPLHYK